MIKRLIKDQAKTLSVMAIVSVAIASTSLITPTIVQFTQIFMYIYILLLIPGFIATKSLEARTNITNISKNWPKIKNEKRKTKVFNTPTEVKDLSTDIKTY